MDENPPKSPPHSHPVSNPNPNSGEKNPPEKPPNVTAAASPTGKRKKITSEPEEEEDDNEEIKGQSTPTKRLLSVAASGSGDLPESLTPSGKNKPPEQPPKVAAAADGSPTGKKKKIAEPSSSSKGKEKMEEKEEEIEILEDILDFYDQNGSWPFAHLDMQDLQDFHDTWFKDRLQKYPTIMELSHKIYDLMKKFLITFFNFQAMIASMNSLDIEIYALSNKVWGVESWKKDSKTLDSTHQETTQDSAGYEVLKDSSSNEQETDSKDSSGYEGDYSDFKDASSKANYKGGSSST